MVADGTPPKDWAALRAAAEDTTVLARTKRVATSRDAHR
jgi:hypothetical protein